MKSNRMNWLAGMGMTMTLLASVWPATARAQPIEGGNTTKTADLAKVPQLNETKGQRDARMQWFRDAKFGMFIHWGPCSVAQREIGWGRRANKPWDIQGPQTPRTSDPVYDKLYKQFNPVKYDAEEWVRFAKTSGMKYMVLICKHHDGFCQFDSKLTDYKITNSPYGKDIVRQFVEACHKYDMKVGLYYSTRDWYHPNYLVGDNVKYDAYYRGQVEELLSNYGKVDMMWFDHVGGRDWGKWRFDELFAMMYRLQPGLLVNDRAAKFCGPKTPEDRGPTPELAKITQGDFYTPEGKIGAMDIVRDWESCIHVGRQWAYGGEDGFQGPEQCIKMLVSCATGGGNLLLNFGPRPDGTFADGEVKVARAMGEWLKKYGEAIYGTRGGPYRNGEWGGCCHKSDKLYLHVYRWMDLSLRFDPPPFKVLSARTLTGAPVKFAQTDKEFSVEVAEAGRDTPVTVIELTLDKPVEDGRIVGAAREGGPTPRNHGALLSEKATLELSSTSKYDRLTDHERLFRGEPAAAGYAFHTDNEKNPWAKIDLGAAKTVKAIVIENRKGESRTSGLILSVSDDGTKWDQVWQARSWDQHWMIPLTRFDAGVELPGRKLRYLKFETRDGAPRPLLLQRFSAYGEE